jgi:hypothetical protein
MPNKLSIGPDSDKSFRRYGTSCAAAKASIIYGYGAISLMSSRSKVPVAPGP